MPGDAPILVNSAGCGAAMKDYGDLLGSEAARRFSARVLDISEWLADRVDELPAPAGPRRSVIVQDPCHLRHVQRAHEPVRRLLSYVAEVVELDDDGLCCGAGGAYSALQPAFAGDIRDRKVASIERARSARGPTAADPMVASANPGCSIHLAAALELDVAHPVDIVAEALGLAGS
jgi:glycolate oxidase iron-sulfur subunit